jgi:hypothetical protein
MAFEPDVLVDVPERVCKSFLKERLLQLMG